MSVAVYGLPCEGVKEILLADDIDNKYCLSDLFDAMYPELPVSKKKG